MRFGSLLVAVAGGLVSAAVVAFATWRWMLWRVVLSFTGAGQQDSHDTYFVVLGTWERAILLVGASGAFTLVTILLYRLLGRRAGKGPAA